MGATEAVARFLVQTSYDQLPPEAVEAARRAFLDTLGVALAGSGQEAGRLVEALAAEGGGAQGAQDGGGVPAAAIVAAAQGPP